MACTAFHNIHIERLTIANLSGGWQYKNCTLTTAEEIKRKPQLEQSGEIKDHLLVIEYLLTKTENYLTIFQ